MKIAHEECYGANNNNNNKNKKKKNKKNWDVNVENIKSNIKW